MLTQAEKCQAFQTLHQQEEAFIIPNPWDVGSAKMLEAMGFKALATTSAGFALTLGRSDGEVSLAEKLDHCGQLAEATSVPINADFENGYADTPEATAANIEKLIETGVAGASIEDFSRDGKYIYDFDLAVEKVQAAAEVVRAASIPFQLTARAENLLRGVNDLDDTIARLQAFEAAGADVLYAPGVTSLEQLTAVTAELQRPFNVLAVFFPGVTVAEFAAAGAKRISVGSALALAALNPLLEAGKEMQQDSSFEWFANMAAGGDVAALLK